MALTIPEPERVKNVRERKTLVYSVFPRVGLLDLGLETQ